MSGPTPGNAVSPPLVDDGRVLWDSTAILVYLAGTYGKGSWLPEDNYELAQVMQWLAQTG